MEPVLRATAIYAIVWILFRLSGRRTMSQMTTFDFALLLIVGEASQQALLGEDYTITNAGVVILTLILLDGAATRLRARWKGFDRVMDGVPVLVMEHGQPIKDRMRHERIDEDDILQEARHAHGLSTLDQVEHAVLEPGGEISVIPVRHAPQNPQDAG